MPTFATYNGSLEELGSHSSVLADSVSDLVDGSSSSLADGREGIDGGDSLGKHGVGSELGELGRPETDGEDALLGDPVLVDAGQSLASGETGGGLERSDQHPVRCEEVLDGGTLSQELYTISSRPLKRVECLDSPGLERISKVHPGLELASRMVRMALPVRVVSRSLAHGATHSAVRHGTVDFSTTILDEVETSAIRRVASWR